MMASTYAGGQQASGIPSSMLGFGPAAAAPFFGGSDQGQRLQYYSSQQHQHSHQQQGGGGGGGSIRELAGRRTGKVKFFDTQKGFGFINDYRPEELGNEEVFVHYTSITAKSGFRSLAEGEEAEYEIVRGPKGYQAANVTGPGGQQVMGDSRSRNPKPAYVAMSPYTAMYPYMQQDPSSFYAASPYQHPMLLMPQNDYRSPQTLPQPLYRQSPHFAAASSPYGSPGPIRGSGYDIGKDLNFGSMSLGPNNADDGQRHRAPGNPAPFGGMFGAIPTFDGSSSLPAPGTLAGQGLPSNAYGPASSALSSGIVTGRSNSLGDGIAAPAHSKDQDSASAQHPSSVLYASASKPPSTSSVAPP